MSGWLGANFSSQLDSLKSQVSSIAKDVFVVDEEEARAQDVWREREAGKRLQEEEKRAEGEKVNGGLGKEEEKLHSLERQLQVAIREKEEQCQTFRELLLEKEKEIEELSGMVEEKEEDEGGEKERMEVWTGYKMKLVEVLRAGNQLNMEEDVSYDQLLYIVEQLVRDKQQVDLASAAVSPKPSRKFVKENSELKKRCKDLEDKLAEKTSSDNLEVKDKEIADLRQHCKEVEEKLEKVVAEKEAALQDKFKEEQVMQLRSKELEEERCGLIEQCKQLEQTLANNTKDKDIIALEEEGKSSKLAAEMTEAMQRLTSDLNLATEQGEAAAEEARTLKERLEELELTSNLQRGELEKDWEIKLNEKDKEVVEKLQNIKRLDAEVKSLRIELESKNVNKEQGEALVVANKEVETLQKLLEERENQGLDVKASLEAEVQACHNRLKAEQEELQHERERLRAVEERAHCAEKKCSSAEAKLEAALAELLRMKGEAVENLTVEAEMEELRGQLKVEREEWKKVEEALKQKLNAGELERESQLSEVEAAISKVVHLEEAQVQLVKEKERLEGLLRDAETNLSGVMASDKEAEIRLEEQLKASAAADEMADALRAEVADLKNVLEGKEADFEGEVEKMKEAGRMLESRLAELQSKLEAASLRESNLMETVNSLQANLSEQESEREQANVLRRRLAEEQAKMETLTRSLQEEQSKAEILKSSLEDKEVKLEAANLREANTGETIELLQSNVSEANSREAGLTETVVMLQNQLASKETSHVETIAKLQKDLNECRLKEASLRETIDTLNKNLVEVSSKEANLTEAMTSLKSINEMVTKSARESEAKYRQAMEEQGKVVDDKTRVEAMLIKVEGEKVQMESLLVAEHDKATQLRHELDQLMSSKEARATEEKDVDEAETVALDKNMMQVLNEKSREVSQLKSEVGHLVENLNREREEKENMLRELEESKVTHSAMNAETVKKLSMLIRDKDLEIESLGERNKSLLEVIDNEKESENLSKVHDEEKQKLLKEIEILKESNSKVKEDIENSNELIRLKDKILELERKLQKKEPEGLAAEIKQQLDGHKAGNDGMSPNQIIGVKLLKNEEGAGVEVDLESSSLDQQVADLDTSSSRSMHMRLETRELQVGSLEERVAGLSQELEEARLQLETASEEVRKAREEAEAVRGKEAEKEQEMERLRRSCANLQSRLDEREHKGGVDQQEVLQADRARLAGELAAAEGEKEQALGQARARLKEAQDLRKEVSSVIEKKRRVEGEVERLRGHLVSVEEGYTTELVEAEDREAGLRRRVASLEDQLRVASVSSTEANQSASQASIQLNKALEAAANQRDTLQEELGVAQASLREKNVAVRNLTLALEGFTRQRDNELAGVERTAEARVAREQKRAAEQEEAARLVRGQLERAQQGLEAAARLGDQLDVKTRAIVNLKQEISARDEMIKSCQEKLLKHSNSQVGRVDRALVRNLIVGYVTADQAKRPEILRIVATVLDFSQEERGKTGLEGNAAGWLAGILGQQRSRQMSTSQAPVDQSIARAFINFLEEESSVRSPPTLPVVEMARAKTDQLALASPAARGSPSPLLSNPTWSPAQNPSNPSPLLVASNNSLTLPSLLSPSPTILRDVLAEEEQGQ